MNGLKFRSQLLSYNDLRVEHADLRLRFDSQLEFEQIELRFHVISRLETRNKLIRDIYW